MPPLKCTGIMADMKEEEFEGRIFGERFCFRKKSAGLFSFLVLVADMVKDFHSALVIVAKRIFMLTLERSPEM